MFFARKDAVPAAKILPWKWGAIAGMILVGIAVERWHFQMPDDTLKTYFASWASNIAELRHLDSKTFFWWLGWFSLASPILLIFAVRGDRRAISVLGMLAVTFALTCWQIRWGYFLALIYAMSLPWQLSVLRYRLLAWPLLIIGLWPTAQYWEGRMFPNSAGQQQLALRNLRLTQERQVAEVMRGAGEEAAFLAPWWQSPPLAYWSGQPGVAGSSHESLAGTVDSALFYTAPDLSIAAEILAKRRVAWVVVDRTEGQAHASVVLEGVGRGLTEMTKTLADYPASAPSFLVETPIPAIDPTRPQFFRLYRVQTDQLQP